MYIYLIVNIQYIHFILLSFFDFIHIDFLYIFSDIYAGTKTNFTAFSLYNCVCNKKTLRSINYQTPLNTNVNPLARFLSPPLLLFSDGTT